MKKYLLFAALAAVFSNCDVRRNDSLADDSLVKKEKQKKELQESIDAALKNTTTVQLIDSLYDFGTVTEGTIVEHSFSFKNTGTYPLVIQDAHPSCGCTVAEKPEQPIKPGETAVIKVSFDTHGKGGGRSEKTITVNSNAQPAFSILKIAGNVTKP